MKVAITTTGNNLDGELEQRFGRAPSFLIIDTDTNNFSVIDNVQNLNAAQGAGIQSAMTVVNSGVKAVITGHCGPKAFRVLKEAGIKIYNTDVKTVRDALALYADGKLTASQTADVEGHWM